MRNLNIVINKFPASMEIVESSVMKRYSAEAKNVSKFEADNYI